MDVISQFIVDLSWGLTFGALIAVGVLAGEAAAIGLGALLVIGVGVALWRRRRR